MAPPAPPLLARWGSGYLRRAGEAAGSAEDPIHVLNADERAALLRVVRGAVGRAALAGILNAVATGFGELHAARHLGHMPEHASLQQQLSYFGIFSALAVSFAVAEIAFLYWDGHQAVGSAVVRTRELHPNHVALLRAVRKRLGDPAVELQLDDSHGFLASLSRLTLAERRVVLRVLAAAAILDGRLARAERRLLADCYAAAGLRSGLEHVEKLRRAFVAGDAIPRQELRVCA